MNHYDVTVQDGDRQMTETIVAPTPAKARAEAWRRFSEPYPDVTFKVFLRLCRSVRLNTQPSSAGYEAVERQYGKRFRVGDRVRLNEGEGRFAGKEGTLVYPGPSTCYAHVVLDGAEHPVVVHPYGCDVI